MTETQSAFVTPRGFLVDLDGVVYHGDRVILIVWILGGALAGLGGVFYGLEFWEHAPAIAASSASTP